MACLTQAHLLTVFKGMKTMNTNSYQQLFFQIFLLKFWNDKWPTKSKNRNKVNYWIAPKFYEHCIHTSSDPSPAKLHGAQMLLTIWYCNNPHLEQYQKTHILLSQLSYMNKENAIYWVLAILNRLRYTGNGYQCTEQFIKLIHSSKPTHI